MQDSNKGQFKLHQRYVQCADFIDNNVPQLPIPPILLSTVNANAFIGCFCEVFQLSQKFSKIRVLNLRGCDNQTVSKQKLNRILNACDQIAHLNLSFMIQQVDEDILCTVGERFQKTLISLQIRACQKVDDAAIVGLC